VGVELSVELSVEVRKVSVDGVDVKVEKTQRK
jgi:hypothetical protein